MSWKREMEVAAAKIAWPDLEIGDTPVSVDTSWEYGQGCPTCAFGPAFEIIVYLLGEGDMHRYRTYENDEAADFWKKLMVS